MEGYMILFCIDQRYDWNFGLTAGVNSSDARNDRNCKDGDFINHGNRFWFYKGHGESV